MRGELKANANADETACPKSLISSLERKKYRTSTRTSTLFHTPNDERRSTIGSQERVMERNIKNEVCRSFVSSVRAYAPGGGRSNAAAVSDDASRADAKSAAPTPNARRLTTTADRS